MKAQELPNLKYDFSSLSRGRLRTYNMLAEELERMEDEENQVFDLTDDDIEMLAAAGNSSKYKEDRRKTKTRIKF